MPQHTNRLSQESSPYLLQHAHNPVDWYPWGEEALNAARSQDKPILLSIGYSSCHWCHVMERESFENEAIAQVMNAHFVNVKVDREERPDLDAIYMNYVQMTTGSGGWPMTVFLTPDQVPFFGGTYFPPEDHHGRPGFKRLLQSIAQLFQSRRSELVRDQERIIANLNAAARLEVEPGTPSESLLDDAYRGLVQNFDSVHGGFGGAPKFPAAMALAFLLRYYRRRRSDSALDIVNLSLNAMGRGGIYDQVGGGFHRYSVDELWLVPHFEKMLYDNALLARVYLEAYQATGNPWYRRIVVEILEYVRREMTDPSGAFYSSQDADSEGEEGKFFVWTPTEVETLLGAEDARWFNEYFDVTASGNFEGSNILHPRIDSAAFSRMTGWSEARQEEFFNRTRTQLLAARQARVAPGRDEKALAAWNGMMLTAFAEAGFVLGEDTYQQAALRNAEFIDSELCRNGRLLRSWKAGQGRLNGYLEDYAQVIEGFLAVYQYSGRLQWLEKARALMEDQIERFWDPEGSDFFFTATDHETLLVRQKEYFDNATPSGNSVSCLNLLRLAILCGRHDYRDKAEAMLRRMSGPMASYPSAFGYWLQALAFFLGPAVEIAVVGRGSSRDRLLEPVRRMFLPDKVVVLAEGPGDAASRSVPLAAGKDVVDGKPAAYVCQDYACRAPVTAPADLETLLAGSTR